MCPAHAGLLGRPTKLTEDVQERILAATSAGNYKVTAAASAGISYATLREWERKGEEGIEPYAAFSEALKRAEAEAEVRAVAFVNKAMASDWKAAMTFLERRHPDKFRRRETHELTGNAEEPVVVAETFTDPETRKAMNELKQRVAVARGRRAGGPGAGD